MLLHRYFIQNGTVLECGQFQPNIGIEIYEVVRVVKGIPLFLEDHLQRFYHSAWLCHLEIPLEEEETASMLAELIRVNGQEEGNIRFSFCFRPTGNFQAYYIPHFYPDAAMVDEGVNCGVLRAERTDPNAKVVHINLRESADRLIQEGGFYEVLLLNHQGEFTEGSRSNLFFLKNGVFITAPSGSILPGITRQKVLELMEASGCKPEFRNLGIQELPGTEAAFLTGTSPKVLPIRSIEDSLLNVNVTVIRRLMEAYDRLIGEYVKARSEKTPEIKWQ